LIKKKETSTKREGGQTPKPSQTKKPNKQKLGAKAIPRKDKKVEK
jgi:hypothetical protein